MEYYSAMEINILLIGATWLNFRIMLKEREAGREYQWDESIFMKI